MKQNSTIDFYLKVVLWIFLCLGLAGIFSLIKTVFINLETSGNESDTLYNIQTIQQSQARYAAKHQGKFAPNFYELIKAENLDEKYIGENPVVNGYIYEMKVYQPTNQNPAFFSINADPVFCDCEARHFYFDSLVIRLKETKENRPTRPDDPTI